MLLHGRRISLRVHSIDRRLEPTAGFPGPAWALLLRAQSINDQVYLYVSGGAAELYRYDIPSSTWTTGHLILP